MNQKSSAAATLPRPSRTREALPGTLDGPPSGDPMHDAFIAHCRAALPRIRGILLTKGLDDPHSLVDQVWLNAWEKFPAMYREEQAALAAGQPSPHKFVAYFAQIASGLAVDGRRELGSVRRYFGVRARRPHHGRLDFEDPAPGPAPADEPYGCEVVADPNAVDPADAVVEREDEAYRATLGALLPQGLAGLTFPQRAAVRAWLGHLPDAVTARHLRCSRYAVIRHRRAALRHLRAFYASRGYQAALEAPTVRLRTRQNTGR